MFEGISSLLNTLNKFNAIDAQCKTLSGEMEVLLPELTDNAMAIQFAKDSIVELNDKLGAMRKGLDATKEHVSPVAEEPKPILDDPEPAFEEVAEEPKTATIEPDFELSPEEDEDDEAGIIVESAPGSIFPLEEPDLSDELDVMLAEVDSDPTPDFEEEGQIPSLSRVEDWDELYQAKVEELTSAGATKEARKLKGQCLEIRKAMYDDNGDAISTPISELSKEAQLIWKAALTEFPQSEDIEEIPEQLNTLEKFNSLIPMFIAKAKESGSQYKADEIEIYSQNIAKAKYDSSGNFISDQNKQGCLELDEQVMWAQMSDGMQEMIDLMSADIPDVSEEELDEMIEKFSEDDEAVAEVDAMLADIEASMGEDNADTDFDDDDELKELLEGLD